VHSGERQSGVSSPDKTVDVFESIGDLSSNGESCDWHSFSSISTSGFDDCGVDWSWDDVMGGHLEIGDETKEENMLSWLWENEKGEEVVNYEKQNAMLLGFFLDLPQ
jgi:myb proto-oncogene protein